MAGRLSTEKTNERGGWCLILESLQGHGDIQGGSTTRPYGALLCARALVMTDSETMRIGAVTYMYVPLRALPSFGQRAELRAICIQILEADTSPPVFHAFMEPVMHIYGGSETDWPELFHLALAMVEGSRVWAGSKIPGEIALLAKLYILEASLPAFLGVALQGFGTCDAGTILDAMRIGGNELLVVCALNVVAAFDESMDVHGPRFLPNVVPLLTTTSDDVKTWAVVALRAIFDRAKHPVPGLFEAFMSVFASVELGDRYTCLPMLANVLYLTDDVDDEKMDQVPQLLASVTGSEDEKAAGLDIAIAIVRKDDAQLEFVLGGVLPVVQAPRTTEDAGYIHEYILFMGMLAAVAGGSAVPVLVGFIPMLLPILDGAVKNRLRGIAVETLSRIAKVAEVARNNVIVAMWPAIVAGLDSGHEGISQSSALAIKRPARFFDLESANALFALLSKNAKEDTCSSACWR